MTVFLITLVVLAQPVPADASIQPAIAKRQPRTVEGPKPAVLRDASIRQTLTRPCTKDRHLFDGVR